MTAFMTLLGVVAAAGCWWRMRTRLERVARAAHELRSPLCAAHLAAHAAGREHGWSVVAPVARELTRAGLALEDLDDARAGRRPSSCIDEVDLGELLEEVAQSWAPLAWPVGREVRVEAAATAPVVHADRMRLAQAVGNLVGNALEHGAGTVVLRAGVDADRARIVVADGGTGLPGTIGALTRRPRGGRGARGRGLAIAQEVARRHDGSLQEERTTGGCRLVLELPLPRAQESRARVAIDGFDLTLPPRRGWGGVVPPAGDPLPGLRVGGSARPAAGLGLRIGGGGRPGRSIDVRVGGDSADSGDGGR